MHAVIFDLDGVLIDSEGLQYEAYSQVLAGFGARVTRAEYAEHWIAAGRGPEYAVRTFGLPLAPDELRALKHPVYHRLLQQQVRMMPGAVAALARLQPHFALAVATNSNRDDAGWVLDHQGLRRFFAAVVVRDDYARAKPEPDAFRTAAARLELDAAACVVVEDSYRGIVAARRAGATPIAVPNEFTRGSDFSRAAAVLDSLDELSVALVERVLGQH
jgi:HAD superfamily hydrolase (TIGR01509 family)